LPCPRRHTDHPRGRREGITNPDDAMWSILKETARQWWAHNPQRLGASLAFYTVLSLAPLLILVIAAAGQFFGEAAARGHVVHEIEDLVGPEGGQAIQGMIANAWHPTANLVATVISLALLLCSAAGVFSELQASLNEIWEAPLPESGSGILALIKGRLLSFGMVLSVGFLLLVSLAVSAVIAGLSGFLAERAAWIIPAVQLVDLTLSIAIGAALFAAMYKILPNATITWRQALVGAIITSLLFTLGKTLLGWYLGRGSVASAYGTAGSFVVLLLWIYYSAQIFLFGAELTHVYGKARGGPPSVFAGPHPRDREDSRFALPASHK
jgi:membrane protein